ncbi:MAG: hypothetical protein ACKO2C_08710 [Actinomycetes bacterium]
MTGVRGSAPVRIRCRDHGAEAAALEASSRGAPVVLLADGDAALAGRLAHVVSEAGGRVVVMVGAPEDPAVHAVVDQLEAELLDVER